MCPQSMATPESEQTDLVSPSTPDLSQLLERQIAAGFSPELAFDLVLHELVVRTAASTGASSAALALARGNEMVCRAATGLNAPDLGVPLNTEEGLSGACLRTREAQLCVDTESDPRVDAVAAQYLGIRSILIVPVVEDESIQGVLEVFSSEPCAFSDQHRVILEIFANDCARLQRTLVESRKRPAAASLQIPAVEDPVLDEENVLDADVSPREFSMIGPEPARLYEGWTLILGAMAILAAIGVSFLVGSRIGWIRATLRPAQVQSSTTPVVASNETVPTASTAAPRTPPSPDRKPAPKTSTPTGKPDELVVYDHGKVIFRMRPDEKNGDTVVAASETAHLKAPPVWLAADLAERRLRNRVEPVYPAAAREARRAGDVVLELLVGNDGSVITMKVVSGDPLLTSAALDAVRQWQYEPYRQNRRAIQFQTDVTIRFSLPR